MNGDFIILPERETSPPRPAAETVIERCLADRDLRRRLGLLKRFDERYRADDRFRELFERDAAAAGASIGLDEDARALRALLRHDTDGASEGVGLFLELQAAVAELCCGRAPGPRDERFCAWRDAQIARCDLQLSRAYNDQTFHGALAVELSLGCSVGCWFCGPAAGKLAGHFRYTEENARLWRETLEAMESILGCAAAAQVFCYWATDPLDNPDYERFCEEVVAVFGTYPPLTTALALKDVARTKRVLTASERRGGRGDRFSILTLGMLDRVHRAFTPEELLFVGLVLQNPEAETLKRPAGRFLEAARRDPSVLERELAKLRSLAADDADPADVVLPQTVSCVTGFLVNMVRRSVQLISPCAPSERWPLGHYVYEEARFESAGDFERVLRSMMDRHMTTGAPRRAPARLMDGLAVEALADGFRVTSRTEEVVFESEEIGSFLRALGEELREGERTPETLAEWGAAQFDLSREDALHAIDAVWSEGALDMEPAAVGQTVLLSK
jgi:radical SAM family RiPP maturation amino acid epimerase